MELSSSASEADSGSPPTPLFGNQDEQDEQDEQDKQDEFEQPRPITNGPNLSALGSLFPFERRLDLPHFRPPPQMPSLLSDSQTTHLRDTSWLNCSVSLLYLLSRG
ncbi:uncharacterized protein UV8b_00720 [Ustilaginoidea virens]|uniref:Uncharacterized protein n=1 Tax=Ustilaginoidea virens TaxID=1159556 RepID=A0A8E5HJD5_USTVR|nr:uncharacterized protein UV8b_00720 [Ustilaginoidea virens]QUC16479.1 hypothetical protein UV8b_00720 [Ustilaginoidea virens]